jgi:hypothetical protein
LGNAVDLTQTRTKAAEKQNRNPPIMTIARVALLQFATIIVSIFFTAMALRGRTNVSSFPVHFRDYGFLLMLVPLIWAVWASMRCNHPQATDHEDVLTTSVGVILLSALALVGFVAFTIGAGGGTLIESVPPPKQTIQPSR